MNYKVLITTSGLGSRLGDLTKYTNKALVGIGAKPVIAYIIDTYPEDVPFVVTLGYFGEHIRDFLTLTYPNRTFEFIQVDPYMGPGSSLGYSMLQAKQALQCPFIFHAADTIVTEAPPAPLNNWIGGYRGQDAAQYSSWTIVGDQYILNDKGALDFDLVHIGLVGIHDYADFWQQLEELYLRDPQDTSLNDCRALGAMLNTGSKFQFHTVSHWYDAGNTKALEDARHTLGGSFKNLYKADEAVYLLHGKVVKFFSDAKVAQDRVKRQTLLGQLVPKSLGHQGNFYLYEYTEGELFARVATPTDFTQFLAWAAAHLWIKKDVIDRQSFSDTCYDFYYHKTKKRVAQFLQANHLVDESHAINGEQVPSVEQMLELINFQELSMDEPYQFHGDFILDNIIKTKNGYCLIDWRQHFGGMLEAGDRYYDLAKLNHNLTVNHDIVHQGLFSVTTENGVTRVDIHRSENLVQCQRVLHEFIQAQHLNLKKVELLTGIIWLNMSPLHEHPFSQFLYYFGKLNLWRAIKKYSTTTT